MRENPIAVPAVALETQSVRTSISPACTANGCWSISSTPVALRYCVALGAEFAQLQDRLAGPIAQGKVQLLSISFDPDHDAPPQLASYLQRSRDRGHGWHAGRPLGADGLVKLKRAFGITVIPERLGGYTHNVAIHLVDPRAGWSTSSTSATWSASRGLCRSVSIDDAGPLRHIAGRIAALLLLLLLAPPVKQALESSMTVQMLMQLPLLIGIGGSWRGRCPRTRGRDRALESPRHQPDWCWPCHQGDLDAAAHARCVGRPSRWSSLPSTYRCPC